MIQLATICKRNAEIMMDNTTVMDISGKSEMSFIFNGSQASKKVMGKPSLEYVNVL